MILVVPPLPTSFQLMAECREAFHSFWGWCLPGWQQVSQCTGKEEKLFPCPYIFVTVFLIDEVWYVIWLVVTAGSMGVIEMKCDSLSLSGASRLAATLRCNHLFSHMSSLL